MYKTLLAPLDGSELSARSLPLATAIARHCNATLHLVTVHDPSVYIPFVPGEVAVPVYDAEVVRARRADAERELNDTVASLKESGLEIQSAVLEGTVVECLAEHAVEMNVDLTIMTTHGRTGFDRAALGSVANAYIGRAHRPTLLIRSDDTAAVSRSLPSGTMLCPLDGTAFAESILPYAQEFAATFGLQMELLSITTPMVPPTPPFGAEAVLPGLQNYERIEEGRTGYLEQIAATCPTGTRVRVVTDGDVADAIIDVTRAEHPAVIAIATHSRGGLMRMFLGSVSHEVLRGCACPMLVYKPDSSK